MAHTTTWRPFLGNENGKLPAYAYAFPSQRIDPLIDVCCVRIAIEHFATISDVSDDDRKNAFNNIKKAAEYFHMEIYGDSFEEMLRRPQVEVISRD